GVGLGNRDIITDFNPAEGDRIDLSGFDESITVLGLNGAYTSSGKGELRWSDPGSYTLLEVDYGGDGTTDFEIEITEAGGGSAYVTGDMLDTYIIVNKNEVGDSSAETITGGNGADTLIGGFGGDTISGEDGDDVIYADGTYFDPKKEFGDDLTAWLDASRPNADLTRPSNSSAVTTWTAREGDISSEATQGTADNKPTYNVNGRNGRPTMSFDGDGSDGDWFELSLNSSSGGANSTYVVATRDLGSTGDAAGVFVTHVASSKYAGISNFPNNGYWGLDSENASRTKTRDFSLLSNDFELLVGSYSSLTTGGGVLYRNGNIVNEVSDVGSENIEGNTTFDIGARNHASEVDWKFYGEISEVMLIDRLITGAERILLEEYLAYKYGNDLDGKFLGADTLTGGSGADRFVWTNASHSGKGSSSARDKITDFTPSEGDRIDFSEFDETIIMLGTDSFTASGATELRWYDAGDYTKISIDWGGDGYSDFEIELTEHGNFVTADLNAQHFILGAQGGEGTSAGETLSGSVDSEKIVGGYGGDTIYAGAGDDKIFPDGEQFTNESVSNMIIWYNAGDWSSLALPINSNMTEMVEWTNKAKSGTTYDGVMGGTNRKAKILKNALNGRNTIYFDGSNTANQGDYILAPINIKAEVSPKIGVLAPYTLRSTSGDQDGFFGNFQNNYDRMFVVDWSNDNIHGMSMGSTATQDPSFNLDDNPTTFITTSFWASSSNALSSYSYINGIKVQSGVNNGYFTELDNGNDGATSTYIGCGGTKDSGAWCAQVNIPEFILTNDDISDNERQ
ncbi:hypothetical protein OAB57_03860, partial [Bacteriovoracaceae bacterium]|nr:hypothetical protein [Bacteriovoracaceae bacterium]